MSIEKKHYVDINLQGNKLVNPTLGTADLNKAGSFGFDNGRVKYYDGTSSQDVANLNDLATLADDIAADITAGFISALKFQGAYDVALNSPELEAPAADAVKAGYVYVASSDGEFFTELVKTGDTLIAKVDNPSTLADWIIVQSNIDFATETTAGIVRMASQNDMDSEVSGAVAVTPEQVAAVRSLLQTQINTTATTLTNQRIADVNAEEARALAAEAALQANINTQVSAVKNIIGYSTDISYLLSTSIGLQSVDGGWSANLDYGQFLNSLNNGGYAAYLDTQFRNNLTTDINNLKNFLQTISDDAAINGIISDTDYRTFMDTAVSIIGMNSFKNTLNYLDSIENDGHIYGEDLISYLRWAHYVTNAPLYVETGESTAMSGLITRPVMTEIYIKSKDLRAQTAEAALQAEIDALEALSGTGLADEVARATAAEAAIAADLAQEILDRAADVNAEETRALAAEAALSTDITNLQTYVDTTVDTAITTLTTDLAAETAARILDVNTEETRALAAEAALQAAIDAVEAVATTTATETQLGVVELATEAEALAGTSTAAVAIIPATMQAKIDTQSTTLVIASNAWTLSSGVYTHTLTHGLECSNPVIETRLSSGDVVSFKETYVTDNSTMITSNVALTEDVIVSFTKIAGTGNIVGNPSNSPVNLSDYVATADLTAAIATETANKAEKVLSINDETASYTLVLTDAANAVDMNVASANTVTIPTNASVAFPIGTQIIVIQSGAGQTSFVAAGGVTILSEASKVKIGAQYGMVTLIKKGTNTWYLAGNLTT